MKPYDVTTFALYGHFVSAWSRFELMLEVVIMRELKLDPNTTSIMFGGMSCEMKMDKAIFLLQRNPGNDQKCIAIRKTRQDAERNLMLHSLVQFDPSTGNIKLVRRSTERKYTVECRIFDAEKMSTHVQQFHQRLDEAEKLCGIAHDDLMAYSQPIEAAAPAPEPLETDRRTTITR